MDETASWYEQAGGSAAVKRWLDAFDHTARVILLSPGQGTRTYGGARTWPIRKFPHSVVYRVDGHVVLVIAIAGHRRAPEYWVPRH